jgi:hypothetical protein
MFFSKLMAQDEWKNLGFAEDASSSPDQPSSSADSTANNG